MTTTYATLTNGTVSVNFNMSPDWKPEVNEIGSMFSPLGNAFQTKSTDGAKGLGGTLTVVSTSVAMDVNVTTLMGWPGSMTLTLPDGRSYNIAWVPGKRFGVTTWATWLWQYVNIWTAIYFQVS